MKISCKSVKSPESVKENEGTEVIFAACKPIKNKYL